MASTDKMNKITENILLNGSKSLKIFKLVVVLFVSEYLWTPLVSPPANALSPASVGRGNGSVVSPPTAGGRGSGILSPPSSGRGALSPPSLHSSSLSPGTPHTLQVRGGLSLLMPPRHPLSSVQVPAPTGPAPVVASAARRGTNVAVSKRTRFALQVLTWVCS